MKITRTFMRKIHNWLDATTGAFFNPGSRLDRYTDQGSERFPVTQATFSQFSYSRRSHFKKFSCLPVHRNKYAFLSDLKVYQDLLVYTFIIQNFPRGSRLLEIGGGNSRIIGDLKTQYECWNLDRFEGQGHGPTDIENVQGFRLVKDYIGNFNPELPDHFFDGVYSISTLEHIPSSKSVHEHVLADINRLLRPGGLSFHCIDMLIRNRVSRKDNGILDYLYAHQKIINPYIPLTTIAIDPDLYTLSIFQYYTRWIFITHQISFKKYGRPFSYNILWKLTD